MRRFAHYRLTGDRELDAKLTALPAKVANKAIHYGLGRAGKRVIATQRRLIRSEHEGDELSTGTLRKSIGSVLRKDRKRGSALLVVGPRYLPRGKYDAPRGQTTPQAAAKYAIGIELGWGNRDGDPFVYRSYIEAAGHFVSDFRRGVGKRIEKLARGGSRAGGARAGAGRKRRG